MGHKSKFHAYVNVKIKFAGIYLLIGKFTPVCICAICTKIYTPEYIYMRVNFINTLCSSSINRVY